MSPYHIAFHVVERKHQFQKIMSVRGVRKHPGVLHFRLHVVCPGMDDRRHLYIWGEALEEELREFEM